MLKSIIVLNGFYDLACALAILYANEEFWLGQLHVGLFVDPHKRMMAYWIFTYGIMRAFSKETPILAASYGIEALAVANEWYVGSCNQRLPACFVVVTCLVFLIMILLEKKPIKERLLRTTRSAWHGRREGALRPKASHPRACERVE